MIRAGHHWLKCCVVEDCTHPKLEVEGTHFSVQLLPWVATAPSGWGLVHAVAIRQTQQLLWDSFFLLKINRVLHRIFTLILTSVWAFDAILFILYKRNEVACLWPTNSKCSVMLLQAWTKTCLTWEAWSKRSMTLCYWCKNYVTKWNLDWGTWIEKCSEVSLKCKCKGHQISKTWCDKKEYVLSQWCHLLFRWNNTLDFLVWIKHIVKNSFYFFDIFNWSYRENKTIHIPHIVFSQTELRWSVPHFRTSSTFANKPTEKFIFLPPLKACSYKYSDSQLL